VSTDCKLGRRRVGDRCSPPNMGHGFSGINERQILAHWGISSEWDLGN